MIIRENIPISELTTMRLGGPARYVIDIESTDDIQPAFAFAREKNLPIFILGGGANTIGHDEGFPGVIIRNAITGIFITTGERGSSSEGPKTWASAPERPEGEELGQAPSYIMAAGGRDSSSEGPKTWASAPERPEGEELGQAPSYIITVMGGTEWDSVVEYAVAQGFTGIEALSKIPGLAGAAPVQNIGAYGQDIAETFISAEAYDIQADSFCTLTAPEMHFSYRHSILNTTETGRYFIISITLGLHHGEIQRPFYNSIERYIAEHHITDFSPASICSIVSAIRADKLPDPREKASAGSFFKNVYLDEAGTATAEAKGYPVYRGHDGLKINSGWLIEQAGLKGKLLHGMRINEKAALVLINESAASYADLAAARTEIIEAVYDKFGYQLEQEPVEISGEISMGDGWRGTPKMFALQNFGVGKAGRTHRGSTRILDGRELAGFIKERQAHQVRAMSRQPHLLIIRDSDNPVITKYVNLKIRYGEDIGVAVTDYLATSTDDIRTKILSANNDPTIHGIILQLPIQDKSATDALTSLIAPEKDVDGLSGNGNYDSATATAINWLLAGYDIPLARRKIAIVGRGKLVGAPLYRMFTNSGYDVTLFHRGDDLTKLNQYGTIITATGQPGLITSAMVAPNTCIVDAGTASENGVLKGDVAGDVRSRTDLAAITPITGGVGPLTVTCLFDHVIQATTK